MFITEVPEQTNAIDTSYNGVCMEVAGIESCGYGHSAQEIPTVNQETDSGD